MRLFLLALLFPLLANAEFEEITGAFGITLGEKFDEKKATKDLGVISGEHRYRFKPDKPFKALRIYTVFVSPKSKIVCKILAHSTFPSRSIAEDQQDVIMAILEKKYGPRSQDQTYAIQEMQVIEKEPKAIITQVRGFSDGTITLAYVDTEAGDQAKREWLELEAEKVDASGL